MKLPVMLGCWWGDFIGNYLALKLAAAGGGFFTVLVSRTLQSDSCQ
jgi:hypothetical protein